ncbi:MAG: hypothetical protein K0S41_1553 [Anaerocolumna sp.]|jgi:predicted HAD superfamily hydrolase|nr:hypothetical protein [Anaerocolumna sp.]
MVDNFDRYDLVSFDIFDTLLLRGVSKPIDIFQIVWDKAKELSLCLIDISPIEFMKMRIECERRARNKAINREVKLTQIYNELPLFVVRDIEKLIEIELQVEKEYCYKNFDIYELIKILIRTGKKVILLSDMYLTSIQIKEILLHNNIDIGFFDSIIVSCEEMCNKQDGSLYKVLFDRYPMVSKDRIMHIGDNKNSDFIQAINNGINAIHYNVIPDKMNSIYEYERIRHNSPQKEIISLRKLVSQTSIFRKIILDTSKSTAYEIGASIIGPFLTTYISWVCDQMEKLQIKSIYPFMREGYLLGELLKREIENRNMNVTVKPIYISRKVTYIPSIERVSREEIENLIGARNLTIIEVIHMVGLDIEDFEHLSQYFNVPLKITHKYTYLNTTLKEYFINNLLAKDNVNKIERYIKEQRELLVAYLKQEIKCFNNVATIDIGFFGRIQLWMEKALDLESIDHNFKHFLAIGIVGEKLYDGINIEGYYGTLAENMDLITTIHRTTDIIEKLISVTEGSTIGYCSNDSVIKPIKSKELGYKDMSEVIFEGIFDYQKYWFKFKMEKPNLAYQVCANRRENLMLLHRLIDMPRNVEVEFLKDLEGDTNFGTDYRKCLITDDNIQLLKLKGADFIDKCNASYTYEDTNIVWPKGLITLHDEFYYVRKALRNSAGNETVKLMQGVVEKLVGKGIHEVALYGAGENGRQFYFVCKLYHVKVTCFIDRKESIWGSQKEGIEIIGLNEAIHRGNRIFIITSLFSISEIKDYINLCFNDLQEEPIILHV